MYRTAAWGCSWGLEFFWDYWIFTSGMSTLTHQFLKGFKILSFHTQRDGEFNTRPGVTNQCRSMLDQVWNIPESHKGTPGSFKANKDVYMDKREHGGDSALQEEHGCLSAVCSRSKWNQKAVGKMTKIELWIRFWDGGIQHFLLSKQNDSHFKPICDTRPSQSSCLGPVFLLRGQESMNGTRENTKHDKQHQNTFEEDLKEQLTWRIPPTSQSWSGSLWGSVSSPALLFLCALAYMYRLFGLL